MTRHGQLIFIERQPFLYDAAILLLILANRWCRCANRRCRWCRGYKKAGALAAKHNRTRLLYVPTEHAVFIWLPAAHRLLHVTLLPFEPTPTIPSSSPRLAVKRVGDIGPGAFMILEHLALVPFGPMRPGNQAALGNSLADLHLSTVRCGCWLGRRAVVSLCPASDR